jgi:hypothetical protein
MSSTNQSTAPSRTAMIYRALALPLFTAPKGSG